MSKTVFSFICLFIIASSAGAATVDGLAMMKIEAGARPSGMGGAFVSIPGDAFSSVYNPAGSSGAAKFTASFGHVDYWENVRLESGFFSSPLKGRFSVHGGIKYASLGNIEVRSIPSAEPEAMFDANDVLFKTGLSYRFSNKLYAGFGAGWFVEKIEAWRGSAFNFDLGLMALPREHLTVGASITNLGSSFNLEKSGIIGSRDISLPVTYRAGASYQYERFQGAADVVILDDQFHMHLGAEARLHEMLAVRAGYMFNYDSKNFTAGATFSHRNLAIDYAFVPYSNDLGTTHMFNFTVQL